MPASDPEDPWAVCPPCEPLWPDEAAPGAPAEEEDAPPGSDGKVEVPVEEELCGAEPGDWLGNPALVLGLLPEPLEGEEDEDEDDGEEEPDEEEDPDGEGIPPEELLEDVAHPAVASRLKAAARAVVRRVRAAVSVVTRSMAVAPSGGWASRFQ